MKKPWNPTQEEIDYYKKLAGDPNGDNDYYAMMLPLMLESMNEQLCQCFTIDKLPASLKIYLGKATGFFKKDNTLKSRHMGTVSYSWDASTLPASISNLLKPYNRCSGGRFVVFR